MLVCKYVGIRIPKMCKTPLSYTVLGQHVYSIKLFFNVEDWLFFNYQERKKSVSQHVSTVNQYQYVSMKIPKLLVAN
jgi:hypothetical protein